MDRAELGFAAAAVKEQQSRNQAGLLTTFTATGSSQ